jgi:hypothetical protein
MRTTAFLMGGLIAATLGAKAYADDPQATNDKFCAAINDYRADLKRLDAIGPNSTVGELRSAADRASVSGQKVQEAQSKMNTPAAKEFRYANMKLKADAKVLPDSTTIAEAKQKLAADIAKVKDASRKLTAEAGCPMQDTGKDTKMDQGQAPDQGGQNPDMGKPQ